MIPALLVLMGCWMSIERERERDRKQYHVLDLNFISLGGLDGRCASILALCDLETYQGAGACCILEVSISTKSVLDGMKVG